MKVKEESAKTSLKLNIQKSKIMASSPITSWQDGRSNGNSERLYFFFFSAPKITADDDCSHKMKTLMYGKTNTAL